MLQLKQITLTDIHVVEVPKDAYDFSMRRNNQIDFLLKGVINPLTGSEHSQIIELEGVKWGLVSKDFNILGTGTQDGFDFDVVEAGLVDSPTDFFGGKYYTDYSDSAVWWDTSALSALSRLAANGLYFVNPMGADVPKFPVPDTQQDASYIEDTVINWQHYQDNLITGKLVFLKLLK